MWTEADAALTDVVAWHEELCVRQPDIEQGLSIVCMAMESITPVVLLDPSSAQRPAAVTLLLSVNRDVEQLRSDAYCVADGALVASSTLISAGTTTPSATRSRLSVDSADGRPAGKSIYLKNRSGAMMHIFIGVAVDGRDLR